CPTGAIGQQKEPIWDIDNPSLYQYGGGKEVKFNGLGKKVFRYDAGACCYAAMAYGGACATCMGTCTFNTGIGAGIHEFVKPMVSTTSLFNGFFWRADGFFGFDMIPGNKKDEWWDKHLPVHAIDSTVTAYDWAYRQRGR
ncbi:MAG: reductive dehalogenase, partial [Chloroflexi bacterium]|nr:reductive dehalogenase [Chloroflexota bacterium]